MLLGASLPASKMTDKSASSNGLSENFRTLRRLREMMFIRRFVIILENIEISPERKKKRLARGRVGSGAEVSASADIIKMVA